MDATSFIWGIALGVLGAFGTGFLKKAGEECYSWVKKKVNPSASTHQPPQIVVNLSTTENGSPSHEPPDKLSLVTVDQVSSVSFDDIEKAISAAPPMQRDRVAASYVGLHVEWDAYFRGGSILDNNRFRLRLRTELTPGANTIVCEVPADKYREFSILPEGAKVRVTGELSDVSSFEVALNNVHLRILHGNSQA